MHGGTELKKPDHIPQEIWDAALIPEATICMAMPDICPSSRHAIRHVIAGVIMSERARNGGVRAANFNGNLVICHPDMPPHIWDGENIRRIES